jgi:anti-sigma factor RsiW
MTDKHGLCSWTLERIDAFLDNEIDAVERARFLAHVNGCTRCADELALAGRVLSELRSLPAFDAPEHIVEAAARAGVVASAPRAKVIALPRPHGRARHAVPAVAAALALAATVLWYAAHQRDLDRERVTDAEVREATAELALAFGYVDKYSEHAAAIVRDDVIEKHVVPRIERAMRGAGRNVTSPPPGRS